MSQQQAASQATEPSPGWITTPVEFRQLTHSIIARGDVVTDNSLAVDFPPNSGATNVITTQLPKIGQKYSEGETITEVSGRPIILLKGTFPSYREMHGGLSGSDITQLQKALRHFDKSLNITGVFDDATKQLVSYMYKRAGYSPRQSSTTATDVLASKSRLREANDAVSAATNDADLLTARDALNVAIGNYQDVLASFGPSIPLGEVAFINSFPAVVTSVHQVANGSIGAQSNAATPSEHLMTLSAGPVKILASVGTADIASIKLGTSATLLDELSNSTFGAVVTAISSQSTTDQSGRPIVAIELRPTKPLPTIEIGKNLRVTLTVASVSAKSYVVPLSAIASNADGSEYVNVLSSTLGTPVKVGITTLMSADGFVAVSPRPPDRLQAGDPVIVGR